MYRVYRGRKILSTEGRRFKEEMAQKLADLGHIHCFTGPVKLSICFTFKTKHRRDIDNMLKSSLDSLSGVLYCDDYQIFELNVVKVIGGEKNNISIVCSAIH